MAGSAWAKSNAVFVGKLTYGAENKASLLNYPRLPKEINEKIQGMRRKSSLVSAKVDSTPGRDWGLSSIGVSETLATLAKPLRPSSEACPPPVIVAVIDTGIDYTHPELKENIWINDGETGPWQPSSAQIAAGVTCRDKSCNGLDDEGDGFTDDVIGWDFVHDVPMPYDTHGHGTHIAGIISGVAAKRPELTGGCQRISLMPLKYYDNSGSGYNNLTNTVRAIRYAVRNGAQIINYSGGGADPAVAEKEAVEEALRKGVLFVAAAGNDGHNNDLENSHYYPASYGFENIIAVASVNQQSQLLPSSNFGRTVHLAAPGLQILSTLPGGRFGTMSGTSQATAFVTGAAALLESQLKQRNFTDYRKLKSWLAEGAKPLPGNEKKTLLSAGLLSLPRALQREMDDTKKSLSEAVKPTPEVAYRSGVVKTIR